MLAGAGRRVGWRGSVAGVAALVVASNLVAVFGGAPSPAWATTPSDNGGIAYVREAEDGWGLLDVWLQAPDQGSSWVATVAGTDRLAFSPDGGSVLLGGEDLSILKVGSADPVSLGVGGGYGVAWSPDGTTIAWVRGDKSQLWIAAADGTGARVLAEFPPVDFHAADVGGTSFSPDGSRLAFSLNPPGPARAGEIWTIDLDSGDTQQLTGPNTYSDQRPVWSPDGRSIAYTS